MKRILVCDDHPLLRKALIGGILDKWDDFLISEAADFQTAIELSSNGFDAAIIDLKMPKGEPYASIKAIMENCPKMPILIVTAFQDEALMLKLLKLGVAGFVSKSVSGEIILAAFGLVLVGGKYIPPELLAMVNSETDKKDIEIPEGEGASNIINIGPLTERQKEIILLLANGKSNKEIGRILNISNTTAQTHVANIFAALKVNNRMNAVIKAKELGILN